MAAVGLQLELLPKDYGYVAIVLILNCLVSFWMAALLARARNNCAASNPTTESQNQDARPNFFNSLQRDRQNFLEMMPVFLMLMVLGGMRYPLISALLGALYTITWFVYFKAYYTGDPNECLSTGSFDLSSRNKNQVNGIDRSMVEAEDISVQFKAPSAPVSPQSTVAPSPPVGFTSTSTVSSKSKSFKFGDQQQNQAAPKNPSAFEAAGSLEFNAGGSFSLVSSDKPIRRIVKVGRSKHRRR